MKLALAHEMFQEEFDGGRRILERIDAVDGDVFRRRPTLTRRDWALVAWRALMPGRRTVVPSR